MFVIFSSSTSHLISLVLLSFLFSIFYPTNAYASYIIGRENVQCMPFITLIEQPRKLHLIKDYFSLVQHLNLDIVIKHIDDVESGQVTVKSKYLLVNGSHAEDFAQLESKLRGSAKETRDIIDVGLGLLPHKDIVKWGKKRSNASTSLGVVCISLIKIVSIPKDVYFN